MNGLVFTALNALANLRDARVVSANNLANQAVPGFRKDLQNDGESFFLKAVEGLPARAFQLQTGPHAFSDASGFLDRTGDPMDLAIADKGWFYVQPEGGEPALSRRADLRVGADGTLRNGAGEAMLDGAMQPIVLPPFRSMTVDEVGQITIEPRDQPGQRVAVGMLATVAPPAGLELRKSPDGRIRTADGSPLPPPDQQARVVQGAREGSNVNATEELIASIELQRAFELNLKMISTAKEMDESGSQLLRPPAA